MSNKMWGGRFSERPDAIMEEINVSIDVDRHLYAQDIAASKAHAAMLAAQGIITSADAKNIGKGLDTILSEIGKGDFDFKRALEDIHMNVESRLSELIGPAAGRLHTARSRNDQVATDFRLYVRDTIDETNAALAAFQRALVTRALEHAGTVMPGFTHLQTAQPVTFGHHLLAWFEMLSRDYERLVDCRKRTNRMPLGSAALAGTTYPIQREITAELLGFDAVGGNSLDGVSDRDFAIEFCAAASLAMMHLSRFSEELVLWTSAQFQFIDLPDRFCTGSSIMPQKKNPDAAELIRAKPGRITGALVAQVMGDLGAPEVLTEDAWLWPEGTAQQLDRAMVRRVTALLEEAGWKSVAGDPIRRNAKGEPLRVEFMNDGPDQDRILDPYIENLRRVGIDAVNLRVDNSEQVARIRSHDFDLTSDFLGQTPIPGAEMRPVFGSEFAGTDSNLSGLANPAVDSLMRTVESAQDEATMLTAVHALDRVLRAIGRDPGKPRN